MFLLFFVYLDQVFPNEFGRKKPIFFFLNCCPRKKQRREFYETEIVPKNYKEQQHLLINDENSECFEKVGHMLLQQKKEKKALDVQNLTKIFPSGKKAVNNLSFTMYNNQIFVLLGKRENLILF